MYATRPIGEERGGNDAAGVFHRKRATKLSASDAQGRRLAGRRGDMGDKAPTLRKRCHALGVAGETALGSCKRGIGLMVSTSAPSGVWERACVKVWERTCVVA